MKIAIFLLVSLFSLSSLACNREAQFIGKVTNLKVEPSSYSFQIKSANWFIPSAVCPMFEDEFESAVIEMEGTPYFSNNDDISGVLVFDEKTHSYRID